MENKNKNNSGALFKNKEKKTDKHPDYNGNIIINDTKYFLSAWVNESKNGLKYLKLSASEEQKQTKTDSDLPF
tara:strand:- start:1997 stop:2215 length:219 start_codon:yes stop_codon:yes gene_type:complete